MAELDKKKEIVRQSILSVVREYALDPRMKLLGPHAPEPNFEGIAESVLVEIEDHVLLSIKKRKKEDKRKKRKKKGKIKVLITQDCISSAERSQGAHCPMANAIKERTDMHHVYVGESKTQVALGNCYYVFKTSKRLANWIARYDKAYSVDPTILILNFKSMKAGLVKDNRKLFGDLPIQFR